MFQRLLQLTPQRGVDAQRVWEDGLDAGCCGKRFAGTPDWTRGSMQDIVQESGEVLRAPGGPPTHSSCCLQDHMRGRRHARRLQYIRNMPESERTPFMERVASGETLCNCLALSALRYSGVS